MILMPGLDRSKPIFKTSYAVTVKILKGIHQNNSPNCCLFLESPHLHHARQGTS